MTKAEFITWATSRVWTHDKRGRLHSKSGNYRFKLSACFQLTRKGSSEPSTFHAIDEEICSLVGEPVHEKYWCREWYDSIGFMLATEKTFDEIRTWCKEWAPTLIEVANFLEANYDVKVWYERGSR